MATEKSLVNEQVSVNTTFKKRSDLREEDIKKLDSYVFKFEERERKNSKDLTYILTIKIGEDKFKRPITMVNYLDTQSYLLISNKFNLDPKKRINYLNGKMRFTIGINKNGNESKIWEAFLNDTCIANGFIDYKLDELIKICSLPIQFVERVQLEDEFGKSLDVNF